MFRVVLLAACALAACAKREPVPQVDLDLIRVVGEARMRTDKVGELPGAASFVLVDAENGSDTGAHVTLGGAFTDADGNVVGKLSPQSLWIPAKDTRTFALVDLARQPRPTATSASIEIRGAVIGHPPRAKIVDLQTHDDDGLIVARATLVNDTDRHARILVIASFHDKHDSPMTRPFTLFELPPRGTQPLQFVGPPGSVRGTIFVGDEKY